MIMQSYDVDRRFAGVGRLYGEDRLEIFKKSHICIVGIGGVGSWVAESLARHGIGKITLIDIHIYKCKYLISLSFELMGFVPLPILRNINGL